MFTMEIQDYVKIILRVISFYFGTQYKAKYNLIVLPPYISIF